MVRKKQEIPYNVYVIAVFAFFALSLVFAGITVSLLLTNYSVDSTRVGPIYLGDRSEKEFPDVLDQEIGHWKEETEYVVEFQGLEWLVDLDYFAFETDQTVNQIQRGQNNRAVFSLSEEDREDLVLSMEGAFSETIVDHVDFNDFLVDLRGAMGTLKTSARFVLQDYLEESISQSVVVSVLMDQLPSASVEAILTQANEFSIRSQARFSLLETLSDTTLDNQSLSIIASGIQKMILQTPFSGLMFHTNPQGLSWSEEEANVRILRVSGYDFSFYNDLEFGFTLNIVGIDDETLRFDLVGIPFANQYVGQVIEETAIPFDTLTIPDASLTSATPGVIITDTVEETRYRLLLQSGIDGKILIGVRTVTVPGEDPYEETVFLEQYLPTSAIYRENVVDKDGE